MNREELHDILAKCQEEREAGDEEIIVCCHCDACPASLAAAVQAGWKDFQYDEEHEEYRGLCPDCVRRQTEDERRLQQQGAETGLTAEQVQQAREDIVTALGSRRPEKDSDSADVPETIACASCDINSPASLAAALQEGWTNLCRDDGVGWNYLGLCPTCEAEENREAGSETTESTEKQRQLFQP